MDVKKPGGRRSAAFYRKEGPGFGTPEQVSDGKQRPEETTCSSFTNYEMELECSNHDPSADVNSMTNFFITCLQFHIRNLFNFFSIPNEVTLSLWGIVPFYIRNPFKINFEHVQPKTRYN